MIAFVSSPFVCPQQQGFLHAAAPLSHTHKHTQRNTLIQSALQPSFQRLSQDWRTFVSHYCLRGKAVYLLQNSSQRLHLLHNYILLNAYVFFVRHDSYTEAKMFTEDNRTLMELLFYHIYCQIFFFIFFLCHRNELGLHFTLFNSNCAS